MTTEEKEERQKKLKETKTLATQKVQDKLEEVAGVSINKDSWKTILKPMLTNLLAPTWIGSSEELETTVDSMLERNPGTLIQTCKAKYVQLTKTIKDFPDKVSDLNDQMNDLSTQITDATTTQTQELANQNAELTADAASCGGYTDAKAQADHISNLKKQATNIKTQMKQLEARTKAMRSQAKAIQSTAKNMTDFGMVVMQQSVSCGMTVPASFTDSFTTLSAISSFKIP